LTDMIAGELLRMVAEMSEPVRQKFLRRIADTADSEWRLGAERLLANGCSAPAPVPPPQAKPAHSAKRGPAKEPAAKAGLPPPWSVA
jgi:hypothetical protein